MPVAAKSAEPQKPTARSAGNGKSEARVASALTREQEIRAFREMLQIRRFEEKAGQLYGMGLIGGFCHLYIGQEAVVIGMQMAIEQGDQVITGYRDHGHMLACGMDPKGVMAELTGRRGGYSKGKGGSMHMFSVEKNFFGGHGIVASRAFEQEAVQLARERNDLRAEREGWERRIALLKPESLDPDLVDELARRDLFFAHPNDLVVPWPAR